MKKYAGKLLSVILALVFLCSTFMMFRQKKDEESARSTYESVQQMVMQAETVKTEPAEPETIPQQPTVSQTVSYQWMPAPVEDEDIYIHRLDALDLEQLRETNPDLIGWIWIPDTQVNYPLMQGEDNSYYLNRTWEGSENIVGSIFLETRNTPELTDFNTIVYGHNMKNGAMFGSLKQYCEQNYAQQHPYVYIRTDGGTYRYEVFAAFEADVESATYGLSFNQEKTRINFLTEAEENSAIETGIKPAVTDRILTLSTCTGKGYDNRWVVQARLKMIEVAV